MIVDQQFVGFYFHVITDGWKNVEGYSLNVSDS